MDTDWVLARIQPDVCDILRHRLGCSRVLAFHGMCKQRVVPTRIMVRLDPLVGTSMGRVATLEPDRIAA